jgi:hypothetical protein
MAGACLAAIPEGCAGRATPRTSSNHRDGRFHERPRVRWTRLLTVAFVRSAALPAHPSGIAAKRPLATAWRGTSPRRESFAMLQGAIRRIPRLRVGLVQQTGVARMPASNRPAEPKTRSGAKPCGSLPIVLVTRTGSPLSRGWGFTCSSRCRSSSRRRRRTDRRSRSAC